MIPIKGTMKKLENGISSNEIISEEKNIKNLRNGYIALSMTIGMTIVGYLLGSTYLQGFANMFSGGLGIILFFAIFIPMIMAIEATQDSIVGLVLLLAFGVLKGVFLTPIIGVSETSTVVSAAIGTIAVSVGASVTAFNSKKDSSKWGGFLFFTMLGLIGAMLLNYFLFQSTLLQIGISSAVIVVMAFFMFRDVQRAIYSKRANYISVALGFYISVINMFVNMLVLLGLADD
jgi:FtsH-binding integral membrane protein